MVWSMKKISDVHLLREEDLLLFLLLFLLLSEVEWLQGDRGVSRLLLLLSLFGILSSCSA